MIRAGGEKLHFLMERGERGDVPCKIHKANWKNENWKPENLQMTKKKIK